MVSSFYSESPILTGAMSDSQNMLGHRQATKTLSFYSILLESGSIVSALEIHTTLKKSRPKRFIMKKVRAFWNRPTTISEIEILKKKSSKMFIEISVENFVISKIFDLTFFHFHTIFNEKKSRTFFEIFGLKNVGLSISKCSNFFHNSPFWSSLFSKSCGDVTGVRWFPAH